MRRCCLRERERAIHGHAQVARGHVVDVALHHRVRTRVGGRHLAAEEHADEGGVLLEDRAAIERRVVAPGAADSDDASAIGDALETALQRLPTDRVDDEIRATPLGQLARHRDEVALHVVDPVVEAELSREARKLLVV